MPSLFDLSRRRPGFNTGPTMGIQPVRQTGGIKPAPGYNLSGTAPLDPTQGALQTGGGDPGLATIMPIAPGTGSNGVQGYQNYLQSIGGVDPGGYVQPGGTRQPPLLPPSAGGYNPSQPISAQPGGNGWGPQTATGPASGRGFGHSYVNPYPGMTGAERVAAKNAEIEAEMAANRAQRMQERQQNQAARQARGAIGEDGQPRGNWMDAALANNEGYQKMQGTYQPKAPTLPYGIPTDGAQFDAFLQSGNFDPNQVRTLRQMAAQMESAYRVAPNMTPEQKAQIEAKIAAINAAIGGYPADTAMNAMFTAPNAWGSGA